MQSEKPVVHQADIVKHGTKIVLPETMTFDDALSVIRRKRDEEEQMVTYSEVIQCFPWEGAIAFNQAIIEMFGASFQEATRSMFGSQPPELRSVETGVHTKTEVPWGRFAFPLDEGAALYTGVTEYDGRAVFQVYGQLKRKWIPTLKALAAKTLERVKATSLYRGQALKISFTDADGDQLELPTPRFIDLSGVDESEMVYTKELTQLIEANIFTPLKYAGECRAAGIPLKRGILAAGPYGTGKSLLARAVAKIGTMNGWTFVYIKDASELPQAIRFAHLYQPAVIFAEDVDRHVSGERSPAMDSILNTLDGIDSKSSEIMVVLTTNHLDQINSAMLRPGRLDVILNVVPPDAEAVTRLVKLYARGRLTEDANLDTVGELLAGYTPAVIREVVERSKLVSITRTTRADAQLTAEDVEISAKTMVQQQDLLKKPEAHKADWGTGLAMAIASQTKDELKANGLGQMEKQVKGIARQYGL